MKQAAVETVDGGQLLVVRKTGISGQESGINSRIVLVVLSLAFLALAPRALGAQGMTVEDPADLGDAFNKALAANAAVVIDVKADKDCPTPVYDFSDGARAWSYHE